MNQIPVFFVHTGYQPYMEQTIHQAERTNEVVYLLGDFSNKKVAKRWVNIENYESTKYEAFRKLYKHMSTNTDEFEFNCFRRFFVSYEFAKEKGINEFVMLDTDCFAFVNFSELGYEGYDVALSIPKDQSNYLWTASPHGSYWTLEALESFLEFLEWEYTENIAELEEKWKYHVDNNVLGGICDMTLLYLWSISEKNLRILYTGQEYKGGIFDHFVSVSEGYMANEYKVDPFLKIKRYKIKDDKAYFQKMDGNWIRAYTIHAQGRSKEFINAISNGIDNNFQLYVLKVINLMHKVIRKIKSLNK